MNKLWFLKRRLESFNKLKEKLAGDIIKSDVSRIDKLKLISEYKLYPIAEDIPGLSEYPLMYQMVEDETERGGWNKYETILFTRIIDIYSYNNPDKDESSIIEEVYTMMIGNKIIGFKFDW